MDLLNKGFAFAREQINRKLSPKNSTEKITFIQLLDEAHPFEELDRLVPESRNSLSLNNQELNRIRGSLIGLAIGDAVGAPVEFRPHAYLRDKPVHDMQGGGTWGLAKGQWTDDTSMALCLAASLIVTRHFCPYDQMLRYQKWFRNGYLSSTKTCFDIGKSTREAILTFEQCQTGDLHKNLKCSPTTHSLTPDEPMRQNSGQQCIDAYYGRQEANGNGSLMRLAPIPLFYWKSSEDKVIRYAAESSKTTHGGQRAIDACRFYAVLIHRALHGVSKEDLLNPDAFRNTFQPPLHQDIQSIVQGSYETKKGYEGGIRGTGYVLHSLEAALWAFRNDKNCFRKGILLAVSLGDDTDTTAAIYGQLAGAVYGLDRIDSQWQNALFQSEFILLVADHLYGVPEPNATNPAPLPATNAETNSEKAGYNLKKRPLPENPDGTLNKRYVPIFINEN